MGVIDIATATPLATQVTAAQTAAGAASTSATNAANSATAAALSETALTGVDRQVKKTSSYTAVAAQDEGWTIVMEAPSSTNIDLTLNDTSWDQGARIRVAVDTPGSGGTVDIVAGGGASLIAFGTVTTLGASHAGAIIHCEFDGTDWLVSSPA